MATCALTQGYTLAGCKDGVGGLLAAYFINRLDVSTYTKVSGQITALTKVTGKQFYKYELQRGTSEWKDDVEGNPDNGTVAYNQEFNMVLNRLQTTYRNEILLLAKNNLWIVVQDRNGNYWLLGEQLGMDLTKGTGGAGKVGMDRSGFSLTFTGTEPEFATSISAAVAAQLTTPGP